MNLSFTEVLTLILITLKLLGVIYCPWWIVFLPFMLGAVVRMIDD